MTGVTLGQIIADSKSGDVLGITDRDVIVRYIQRAFEIGAYKANWNPLLVTLDICTDCDCWLTLPSFVEAPLAMNLNGSPSYFRNSWFEYHINGPGERCIGGGYCSYTWDDKGFYPTFQEIKQWSCLAAIVENPADGAGNLSLTVRAITVDCNYNEKEVTLQLPLLTNYASTDPNATLVKKVLDVQKPVTAGYVKLIAFPPIQASNGKVLGYYEPGEIHPSYRRIKTSMPCKWARIRCRRKLPPLINDYDIVPLSSSEAIIRLLKSIRLSETNNLQDSLAYQQSAIDILQDFQAAEDGSGVMPIQVDPSFGIGTLDYR